MEPLQLSHPHLANLEWTPQIPSDVPSQSAAHHGGTTRHGGSDVKATMGNPCFFCGCRMNSPTKPQWIIDYKAQKVLGLAHSTCTRKAKLEYYRVKPAEWGETSPSQTQIAFASRIITALDTLDSSRLYLRILLYECCWKANSPSACLELPRVQKLLDWWAN